MKLSIVVVFFFFFFFKYNVVCAHYRVLGSFFNLINDLKFKLCKYDYVMWYSFNKLMVYSYLYEN